MTFVNEGPPGHTKVGWATIDKKRNIKLEVVKGISHGDGSYFNLFIDAKRIYFGTYLRKKMRGINDIEATYWSPFVLNIPEELKNQTEEIKSYIKEALTAYGWLYDKRNIEETTVDFAGTTINYYQGELDVRS